MKKIYYARASFYDVEISNWIICVGFNKKQVKKKAIQILTAEHRANPFPSSYFGNRPIKVDGHFVIIEETEFVG